MGYGFFRSGLEDPPASRWAEPPRRPGVDAGFFSACAQEDQLFIVAIGAKASHPFPAAGLWGREA
jgi:hypothetical protein